MGKNSPNYIRVHTNASYSPQLSYHLPPQNLPYNSSPAPSQHVSVTSAQHRAAQQPPMQAMHTRLNSASPSSCSSGPSQVWLTDSGATNHMTADLGNLRWPHHIQQMKRFTLPMVKF